MVLCRLEKKRFFFFVWVSDLVTAVADDVMDSGVAWGCWVVRGLDGFLMAWVLSHWFGLC